MKYKIRPNVKILQRRGINHFFAEVEATIAECAGKMFDEAGFGYWDYEAGDYMITAPPNAKTVMKSFIFEAAYEPADPLPDPVTQALQTIHDRSSAILDGSRDDIWETMADINTIVNGVLGTET